MDKKGRDLIKLSRRGEGLSTRIKADASGGLLLVSVLASFSLLKRQVASRGSLLRAS